MNELPGILLVAALPLELRWVRPRSDLRWIESVRGPGAILARQAMDSVNRHDVDTVVSVGMCGAVDPTLRLGQIVVATEVNGQACSLPACKMGSFRSGAIASIDFVAGCDQKRRLRESGAVAVEMEAAAVQQRAASWGKPFFCVKAVSDASDEAFVLDLNASRDEMGSFRTGHIVWQALRKPLSGIPELFRLQRNSKLAAKALGDFLAHCSF